jgi:hypothetical protein
MMSAPIRASYWVIQALLGRHRPHGHHRPGAGWSKKDFREKKPSRESRTCDATPPTDLGHLQRLRSSGAAFVNGRAQVDAAKYNDVDRHRRCDDPIEDLMSEEDLKAELARLKAENEQLKSQRGRAVSLKVSEKGGVSVYGLGRFPVTLYKEQWTKLLSMADEIRAFIKENDAKLKAKPEG